MSSPSSSPSSPSTMSVPHCNTTRDDTHARGSFRGRGRGGARGSFRGRGRGNYAQAERVSNPERDTASERSSNPERLEFRNSAFTNEARQRHEDEKKRLSDEKFSPLRGEKFKEFITGILTKQAKLPVAKVNEYLKHLDIFEQAFTHSSANAQKNYEALEILGDSILNFCVVNYLSQRFPELMADDGSGVGTLARLKINLVSKAIFSQCAENLGFGDYIASDMLTRRDEMPSLLEDTFEAFNGALIRVSALCDENSTRKGYMVSLGPGYRIVSSFFDGMEISLKYEDLYDAKTRFKQLLDGSGISSTIHYDQDVDENGKIVFTATLKVNTREGQLSWQGKEFKKAAAEQHACEVAIRGLKKMGYGNRMNK